MMGAVVTQGPDEVQKLSRPLSGGPERNTTKKRGRDAFERRRWGGMDPPPLPREFRQIWAPKSFLRQNWSTNHSGTEGAGERFVIRLGSVCGWGGGGGGGSSFILLRPLGGRGGGGRGVTRPLSRGPRRSSGKLSRPSSALHSALYRSCTALSGTVPAVPLMERPLCHRLGAARAGGRWAPQPECVGGRRGGGGASRSLAVGVGGEHRPGARRWMGR